MITCISPVLMPSITLMIWAFQSGHWLSFSHQVKAAAHHNGAVAFGCFVIVLSKTWP
jgi:hypothetical protein